jgi:hypothetical protein
MAAKSGSASSKNRRNKSLFDAGIVDGDDEPGGGESHSGTGFTNLFIETR